MAPNPNPNEPTFPYGGGTDNPGDDTSKAGGPTSVASVETAPLAPAGSLYPPHAAGTVGLEGVHPGLPAGLSQVATDTPLGSNVQAIPPSGTGFESGADYGDERSADTGGVIYDPISGEVRVPGQDETAGETEVTTDQAPSAFPEPNP